MIDDAPPSLTSVARHQHRRRRVTPGPCRPRPGEPSSGPGAGQTARRTALIVPVIEATVFLVLLAVAANPARSRALPVR
jgi:hypothetical protein